MSLRRTTNLQIYKRYRSDSVNGELYLGDALDFLRSLQPESAAIVFLDPPFNLGKQYAGDDNGLDDRPPEEYYSWMIEILDESIRALEQGGALYLYHLPSWAIRLGSHLIEKLDFRHWIAISMKSGFVRGDHLYPAHYSLLYFTRGNPAHFTRPRIPPTLCRHCGGVIKDYGGYKSIIEQKGINLSDFWEDISPVRHSNTKLRSANQLPMKLLRRVIGISGAPGMMYVDPFAGTGTGIIAALENGLVFKACDIVESNCSLIHRRIVESGYYDQGVD